MCDQPLSRRPRRGTIEKAQAIAAHESPRTTKHYGRTSDEIKIDEVERIATRPFPTEGRSRR
jgi:hypothetical protein